MIQYTLHTSFWRHAAPQNLIFRHSLADDCPSYRGYLLIPGPGPAPLPPTGAPLLGLMSCPASDGAEMEAGAPVAGTAVPGCPACPSPSILASFPIASG